MVSWGPSAPGLLFTKSDSWRVSLHEGQISVISTTIRRSGKLSKDALTRARRSVTIFTVDRMVSPLVLELVKDLKLIVRNMDSKKSKVVKCQKCKTGSLRTRAGQYGDFIGCTAYPACKHTEKIPKAIQSHKK